MTRGRARELIGEVVRRRNKAYVRDIFSDGGEPAPIELAGERVGTGAIVRATRGRSNWRLAEVLARGGSARAGLYSICQEHQLSPLHEPAAVRESRALVNSPGLDDPKLEDLRGLPFVTIDGPGTRDLDQALYIEQRGKRFDVYYALADASFAAPAGSALFDASLQRGASYYLPGLAVPMLPRPLSEGIVSLNPRVERRALVFVMRVAPDGRCSKTRLVRARIKSRGQLTFADVEAILAGTAGKRRRQKLATGVEASMRALREVGELRLADARRRNVVRYRRSEVEFKLGREGMRFAVTGGIRGEAERYNEQISLMCNIEGAQYLRRALGDERMKPVFRVHPAPSPERYVDLERLLAGLCKKHRLDPKVWRWRHKGNQPLAAFLRNLPDQGSEGRLARAVHRQAVMLNFRSTFSNQAARHFGVGADVYARFSAPMREVVGVYLHQEAVEHLEGRGGGPWNVLGERIDDDTLRSRVVERGNEARLLQRTITKQANGLVLDHLFARDSKSALSERPVRRGTVMGLTRSKAHVLLDDPPVEVKVYSRHLE